MAREIERAKKNEYNTLWSKEHGHENMGQMTWPQTNTAATRTKLGNLQSQTRKNDEMIKRNATITTAWEWRRERRG